MKPQLPHDLKVGDMVHYPLPSRAELINAGELRWHIMIAEAGCGASAVKRLEDLQLKPYLPVIHKKVPGGRRRMRIVEEPMFGSYFFLPLGTMFDDYHELLGVKGVQDFMLVDGARPAILPAEAIEAIRAMEGRADRKYQQEQIAAGKSEWQPGQTVWANFLPFRSMLAEITSLDARGRIEVLLEMEVFGRRTWSLTPAQLQRID